VENFEPVVARSASTLASGDAFLLCTDGFWEYIEERDMERALSEVRSAEEWLRRMERQVVERGGKEQDNYSALAVWCTEPDAAGGDGELPPAGTATTLSL
jgi:serine/threonine protein phosphatase PrpC